MTDPQTPVTSGEPTAPAAAQAPDATTTGSSDESNEDAPLDLTAQQAQVAGAQAQAALDAELAASRRARGHIPELIKRLDAAEARLDSANAGTGTISVTHWNGLLDAVGDLLPAGVADRLRVDEGKAVSEARIDRLEAELEKAKNPKQPETETEDPQITALRTGWEQAYVLTHEQATALKIAPEHMPTEADWKTAFDADPSSPSKAMEVVLNVARARARAAARRGERADAASGGGGAQATRKGGLTREMMRQPDYKPSDYTREERDAALRAQ